MSPTVQLAVMTSNMKWLCARITMEDVRFALVLLTLWNSRVSAGKLRRFTSLVSLIRQQYSDFYSSLMELLIFPDCTCLPHLSGIVG